jgi:hypothetical protein
VNKVSYKIFKYLSVLPLIDYIVPPAPGDFILELMKALTGNNHNFRHDFIAQLGVVFEEPGEAAFIDHDDFTASSGAMC